jgi:iron complex outermembrane recepter protein
MKLSPLLSLLFIFPSLLQAQQVLHLRDASSGKPVRGAYVYFANDSAHACTDQGLCHLPELPAGQVEIRAEGYSSLTVRLSSQPRQTLWLFPLTPSYMELVVEGFSRGVSLGEQAASISTLTSERVRELPLGSLVPAMNTLPGVRMEERSPASYRLSIRGSLLRAPFGVRNVKVYWNGIPFTEAGGSTPLNLLDPESIGRIEVIKGPGSSLYGAGTGGVVLLESPPVAAQSVVAEMQAGSFGQIRMAAAATVPLEKGSLRMGGNGFSTDGYRDHSAVSRQNAWVELQQSLTPGWEWKSFALYSQLRYQIPGGLTQEQWEENPRQARPGSASQNSSIHQNALWLGTGYDRQWENFYHTLHVYAHGGFFDHPFILDYKRETDGGTGGRSTVGWTRDLGTWNSDIQAGTEIQGAFKSARNFGNVAGKADTLRFDDELRTALSMGFVQATFRHTSGITLTGGISTNRVSLDIYRLRDMALDTTYRAQPTFGGIWAPRFGLAYRWKPNLAVHASVSRGFSPPTLEEIRTNEGSINRDLQPEAGLNREVGVRWHHPKGWFQADATLFRMELRETIVTYVSDGGVVLFRNAGNTRQDGLELAWALMSPETLSPAGRGFSLSHSLTLNRFVFRNYERQGVDYSGNALTGVPGEVSVLTLRKQSPQGFGGLVSWNYTSTIPLNDASTVWAPSYQLVQAKVSYSSTHRWGRWEVYVGVDNVLNERYSLGNDLNVFGGRFFQPAPSRNFFGGMKWRL